MFCVLYIFLYVCKCFDVLCCVFRAALQDLFLSLFMHQVMEDVYPATMAQYVYSFYTADQGLFLKVDGFNQKLPVSCLPKGV